MALELSDINHVTLISYVDAAGDLQLRHQDEPLAQHGDHVVTTSDAFPVRFEVIFATTVGHEDVEGQAIAWSFDESGHRHDLGAPTAEALEVTVEVEEAGGATGATKKKVVYIEAKPKGGLPDTEP